MESIDPGVPVEQQLLPAWGPGLVGTLAFFATYVGSICWILVYEWVTSGRSDWTVAVAALLGVVAVGVPILLSWRLLRPGRRALVPLIGVVVAVVLGFTAVAVFDVVLTGNLNGTCRGTGSYC
jgi:hypothetical protein